MDLSRILRRRLSITGLVMGLLLVTAACGADSTPTVAPTPTPTVAPTATPAAATTPTPAVAVAPTPTPTIAPTPNPDASLNDLLSSAAGKLAAISTVKFQMVDELESGAKFFGMTVKSVEGEVRSPDRFRMVVAVETPNFGFVEIEMLAVGEQAYMKFSEDAPWAPLPLDQVPFNFGGIGVALSELLPILQNASIAGRESIGAAGTVRIDGDIVSEDLSGLITSLDSGHAVTLTFWIDETEHTIRQFRINGKIYNDDGPGTQRLVSITDINVPVDIQLPDIDSKP